MIFDVESIGLHGEGYAVAWTVVTLESGSVVTEGRASCPSDRARGFADDRLWIQQNVDPHLPPATHEYPLQVRRAFWQVWRSWATNSTQLVAHCGWPVEARFLAQCVDDHPFTRRREGPFPLRDVSDFLFLAPDTAINRGRLPNELPEHDPMNDVRHSARLFLEAIKAIKRDR